MKIGPAVLAPVKWFFDPGHCPERPASDNSVTGAALRAMDKVFIPDCWRRSPKQPANNTIVPEATNASAETTQAYSSKFFNPQQTLNPPPETPSLSAASAPLTLPSAPFISGLPVGADNRSLPSGSIILPEPAGLSAIVTADSTAILATLAIVGGKKAIDRLKQHRGDKRKPKRLGPQTSRTPTLRKRQVPSSKIEKRVRRASCHRLHRNDDPEHSVEIQP
ncbi:MAG: hypothetical protein ACQEP8_05495 [Chlamydiota bacterium]